MKMHLGTDGMDYASFLAVVEIGGAGFTWEIVTRDRRTSAVVATKRGEVCYKTKSEATKAGGVVLKAFVPNLPERSGVGHKSY